MHPSRDAREVWWGMLATHPDRRGEKLALVLGAMAMIDLHDRFGITRFFTGVAPGNSASQAVCARMGLSVEPFSVLSLSDPAQLPGGRMTK
jgi:RimJ/RimL family protein N-acetyltransferase